MGGDAPKEHCRFFSKCSRNEYKVFVGQGRYWQPICEVADVFIRLVGRPSPTVHLATPSIVISIALPREPNLLLPFKILNIVNRFHLQLLDNIPHVGEEVNNGLHRQPLKWIMAYMIQAMSLQAFAYLIDPELQSQIQPFEGLLLENSHSFISVLT